MSAATYNFDSAQTIYGSPAHITLVTPDNYRTPARSVLPMSETVFTPQPYVAEFTLEKRDDYHIPMLALPGDQIAQKTDTLDHVVEYGADAERQRLQQPPAGWNAQNWFYGSLTLFGLFMFLSASRGR